MTKTKGKPSIAAFVRTFAIDAPVGDVVKAGKAKGLKLAAANVYQEQKQMRKRLKATGSAEPGPKGGARKRRRGRPKAKPHGNGNGHAAPKKSTGVELATALQGLQLLIDVVGYDRTRKFFENYVK